jgi:hypothetical protein
MQNGQTPLQGDVGKVNEGNSKALSDLTNQLSSCSQANRSKPSTKSSNTSTNPSKASSSSLARTTLDRNNNIILMEINTFRLLFKIHDKLKKHSANEK